MPILIYIHVWVFTKLHEFQNMVGLATTRTNSPPPHIFSLRLGLLSERVTFPAYNQEGLGLGHRASCKHSLLLPDPVIVSAVKLASILSIPPSDRR